MYTVEIYRADKRTKAGEKLWFKQDFENTSYDEVERMAKNSVDSRERYEIHETFVTRTSLVGGQEFQERYDTPYYCSPSSETYWAM